LAQLTRFARLSFRVNVLTLGRNGDLLAKAARLTRLPRLPRVTSLPRRGRRSFIVEVALPILAFGAVGLGGRLAFAEEVAVPVARQAELLVRVAAYDRNLPARAQGKVRIRILTKPDDADSRTVAAQMDAALRKFDNIAGLPYEVTTAPYPGSAQLAASCKADHLTIVYLTPALDGQIGDLAHALEGVDVLSVASLVRYVDKGVVIGFDLVSGKPTLVINLPQAKKQNVDFPAEVLHLMKVIQ
jgi:hypothetical protein